MENTYIGKCVDGGKRVKVIMLNGFQMPGVIVADFMESIVIKSDGKEKLVFKHAISTIEPA